MGSGGGSCTEDGGYGTRGRDEGDLLQGNLCLTMQLHASELQMPVLNSEPFRNSKGTNQLSTKASNTGGEKNREKREK
jgi:hypothetical protein